MPVEHERAHNCGSLLQITDSSALGLLLLLLLDYVFKWTNKPFNSLLPTFSSVHSHTILSLIHSTSATQPNVHRNTNTICTRLEVSPFSRAYSFPSSIVETPFPLGRHGPTHWFWIQLSSVPSVWSSVLHFLWIDRGFQQSVLTLNTLRLRWCGVSEVVVV